MTERDFKNRTRRFGLGVIRLVESLPRGRTSSVIGRQLLRSGTSVGANYRAACRGRSRADMRAKLAIVEEELDESLYWIQMLIDADLLSAARADDLLREANEILAMTVASIRTLRTSRVAQ